MMRRIQKNKSHGSISLDAVLPDTWPGSQLEESRRVTTSDAELLMPSWIKPDWVDWSRVTIIGRDPLAVTGLRYLLARQGTVRLKILTDIPELAKDLDSPDVLIWIRVRNDGISDLAGVVAKFSRKFPKLKQLVISDALPINQAAGKSIFSGVWQANAREKVSILYRLLSHILTTEYHPGTIFREKLGRMQWKVLLMRANGADTNTIAKFCGIGVKTVSAHESVVKKRMNIRNRTEYAWLLRSSLLLKEALPAIERILLKQHKYNLS